MKILVLANTALAGSPASLSSAISKYSDHSSIAILARYFTSPELKQLRWNYSQVAPDAAALQDAVNHADVIIQNQRAWSVKTEKPQFILYHAQPGSYAPGHTDPDYSGKKMVVAQYHTRFYTDATPMPNIIDIWDDKLLPIIKSDNAPLTIFMGVASETPTGWGRKGSKEVKIVFEQLQKTYGDRVRTIFMQGRPMDEVYQAKQKADIVIGDIITGSYHRGDLEGLSYGALTINNIDKLCEEALTEVTGTHTCPFIKANTRNLFQVISHYIENRAELEHQKKEARKWAERYWDPKTQIQRYIHFIESRL